MSPASDQAFCMKCNGFYTNLLSLAHVAEARGFALPHEKNLIAQIKAWRKAHRAEYHGGQPVGSDPVWLAPQGTAA